MHVSVCSLVFFSQGRDMAALCGQGRTGKTSGCFEAGDSCRSISSLAPHAPQRKKKGVHTVRVILFYLSMDTKGVDYPVPSSLDSHHTVPQTGVGSPPAPETPRCFAGPALAPQSGRISSLREKDEGTRRRLHLIFSNIRIINKCDKWFNFFQNSATLLQTVKLCFKSTA